MTDDHAITVEFHRSLAMSVSAALTLLGHAEEYEGFDPSLYAMYNALQEELRNDIRILFKPFGNVLLFDGLLEAEKPIEDLRSLVAWIGRLPTSRIDASNLVSVRALAEYAGADAAELTIEQLRDSAATGDVLREAFRELEHLLPHVEQIAAMIANPEELRANLIYVVTRFWDRHYQSGYAEWKSIEQRSVETLSRKDLSGGFQGTFREITGRDYPTTSAPPLDGVERVVFIPSCFPGPYLSINRLHRNGETLSIVYNCRPSGVTGRSIGIPVEEAFGPLKALADETRLEILGLLAGRELYAQQIVRQMKISQPAVSRHLRLMVACDVLNVRKQDGMKFYTINTEVLKRLGEHLSGMAGPESP